MTDTTFRWTYSSMYDFCTTVEHDEGNFFVTHPTPRKSDLFSHLINAKKYRTASSKERRTGVIHTDAIQYVHEGIPNSAIKKVKYTNDRYPYGVYFFHSAKARNMFFTFPRRKTDAEGNSITTGDHLSFMYDIQDENTPVHLHATVYNPHTDFVNKGSRHSVDNFIQETVDIPYMSTTDLFDSLTPHNVLAYDMCHLCPPAVEIASRARQDGGGSSRKKKRKRRNNKKNKTTLSQKQTQALSSKLIEKLVIIGFKPPEDRDRWHLVIFVYHFDEYLCWVA